MNTKIPKFDKRRFDSQHFVKRVEKPWGFELHWVPEGMPYMGKLLHINAGKRISLQIHDQKLESWFLMSGKALLLIENSRGEMEKIYLKSGVGYTVQTGQRHRLCGETDIEVLEVSTPEIGNTYRLEDDYSRPTETEKIRNQKNRGWKGK